MPPYSGKIVVYQVNTWVWLEQLSRQHETPITLANVPNSAIEALAREGVDVIWLMGVWQRSPFAQKNALKYKHEYRPVLPDITDDDVIGSAYAIYDYRVDDRIGKREGLASFRERLKAHGLGLILDFVPNHVASDHAWTHDKPDYIVQGQPQDLINRPADFYETQTVTGKRVLAHGKDPYFSGWADTAQLNVFNPDVRREMVNLLREIAAQCDGVRCDMAMLLFDDIFAHTWNGYVTKETAQDYWREIIPQIKAEFPDFLFVAEVYWDREYETLQQGFDYAYDKLFYDRVIAGDVAQIRSHLLASIDYQRCLMRFLENHDEPRAYATLGHERSFPAATLICTLPGAALIHEGQLIGRTKKLPVQIKRQPAEPAQKDLEDYYLKLLKETSHPIYRDGQFFLFHVSSSGSGDNTYHNLLAYGWHQQETGYRLIVVNLTPNQSYGRLNLSAWDWVANHTWRLYDVTDDAEYTRHGGELTSHGLFIDLEPYESHVFRFERVEVQSTTEEHAIG